MEFLYFRRGYRDKLKLLPRLADNWSLLTGF